jgi:hypothetical protein
MAASGDRATCGNLWLGICLTDANLPDDFFLFYKQSSNRNTFLSVGLALGLPGTPRQSFKMKKILNPER